MGKRRNEVRQFTWKRIASLRCKKKYFRELSIVQLFELFFSSELKQYILECTLQNGCDITLKNFETFVGIVNTSIFKNYMDLSIVAPYICHPANLLNDVLFTNTVFRKWCYLLFKNND